MKNLKEECPNCKKPNKGIKPMPDGTCGVCAGKGFIIWKCIGKLKLT